MFKNNQAYDRLWEARKLWGGITNSSRTFGAMVIALVPDKEVRDDLLTRHIAYINVLRMQLRRTIIWATNREHYHRDGVKDADELKGFEIGVKELFEKRNKMDIYEQIKDKGNIPNLILKRQILILTQLKKEGKLDQFEHSDLVKQIGEFYNLQGGCERIKSTPLFRQYSIFSRLFVDIFIVLLPFALLNDLNKLGIYDVWLTIPFSLLISWVFFTMEQVGEFSENAFDNSVNDVPLSAICTNIEIDLLEMMGETQIPPRIQPHDNVLL